MLRRRLELGKLRFWRMWNATGSDHRGNIGVLEAYLVEPAHNKQSFEGTPVLSRLENRVIKFQNEYRISNYHEFGWPWWFWRGLRGVGSSSGKLETLWEAMPEILLFLSW
ncbi:hypothetical protein Dsin_010752 [Dipteronia sinensis]|uniref:Morc S5 domain-containing protein n=1 Tax=Dipteronia sinensis TaxID=43782 RepID=A0AAE0ATE6_9ROSI|nr:hypothetical protein Dsin_010752 [Dipteronia sinensis]